MTIKKLIKLSFLTGIFLSSCNSFPYNGDINNATVYHWENDYVTMKQFITDHKLCLGVKGNYVGSQEQNIFNNMKPRTIPRWDNLWATFESRDFREAGQRISFSLPSEGGSNSFNSYKKCMETAGYNLTYRR